MSSSQQYELRRREKENQSVENTKRRIGKRPSDDGVVALEETNAASPQRLKTLDTHESPWRWEREESDEDLAASGLPRKKENVRKKKRWEMVIGSKHALSVLTRCIKCDGSWNVDIHQWKEIKLRDQLYYDITDFGDTSSLLRVRGLSS